MPRNIYVEIPRSVGDNRVDKGSVGLDALAARGAAIGGTLGSVVPGLGNAAGTVAGAVVGFFGGLFGLGSGRDEVRDVFRQILATMFGQILPGKVELTGSARDIPRLADQYRPEDIRAILDEMRRAVLSELTPGSDTYNDLALAFSSLTFSEVDTSAYTVLEFQAVDETIPAPPPSGANGNISTGGPVADPGRIAGLGPGVLAAIGVGVLLLARR